MIETDQLITFERIVREGSFSKAAFALGISQPTISARIQALERELGGTVFTRGRKIALTERGNSFLPYVQKILSSLQDGLEAARLSSSGERGALRIGALRSLTVHLLAPAVAAFVQRYPQAECQVREGDHWLLMEQLVDGLLEVALICYPPINAGLAEVKPILLLEEEMILAVNPSHPLAGRSYLTSAELLEGCGLLLQQQWWQAMPLSVAALAAKASAVADVPMEVGRYLLRSSRAAGFFPKMLIAPDLEAGELVALELSDFPPLLRQTALVHLARQPLRSSAAQNFADLLEGSAAVLGVKCVRLET